jgi:hypothetical protein
LDGYAFVKTIAQQEKEGSTMKRREIEALAERLLAKSTSKLSGDQPELQEDLKIAAGLIFLLAGLPDVELDVVPPEFSQRLRFRPTSH